MLDDGSYYPGVLLEVGCPKKLKSLREKAEDFIVGSGGQIQLMISLDIGEKKSNSMKISAWRPKFYQRGNKLTVKMKAVMDQNEIRDSHGKVFPGSFSFQLRDFGSNLDRNTRYAGAHLTKVITLDYHDLVNYLTKAQKHKDFPAPRDLKVEQDFGV